MNLNERIHQVEEMLAETLAKMDNQSMDIAVLKHEVGKLRSGQLQLMQAYIHQSENIEYLLAKSTQIDERLNSLENRISILETRMDRMEGKIDAMNGKITTMDGKITAVDGKITAVEGKIDTMQGKIDDILVFLREKLK